MHIYLWQHSTAFSSWSLLDEPQILHSSYTQAQVAVLAASKEEALQLLERDGQWSRAELERIEPQVLSLDKERILMSCIKD